jgi:hypothetical protein
MALTKKSDGLPNGNFYSSKETEGYLEDVKTWLQKNHKKVCFYK